MRGLARRAASSAPARVPTAMTVPSSPNCPAPTPNTSVAIMALVSWKFSPKVETTNASPKISIRSGRRRT